MQVGREVDMGTGIIDPMNRNFLDPIANFLGKRKYFDIEPPATNARLHENPFRRVFGKCLETALGIPNAGQDKKLDEKVAKLTGNPFVPWLRRIKLRAFRRARSDNDVVTLLEERHHLCELVD